MMLVGYNSSKLFGILDRQASTISIESGIQNGTVGIAIGNIILSTPEGSLHIVFHLEFIPY